ncbi:hypothetical protein PHYBLDRAFT_160567 [Phycomyces blakesleeanus NRRL 1555(-)]|uniref:Uncharacterized protein n=1 Tax=Phycomyces blakesleeanus (strain ATCC 8743b / DSM 1359 / FGSC 10004 / NBRC 33097 / NRRL 1555) TaxID=763407 RepID=A0A167JU37_PHYB8|nr:hypothetical protein PHYBLDRAFT_160567 [Phycomyces blakesleeanus NRRL 1555(-)]OAD66710.1 hypothetical protein PHYBLDRAFT_160567 [Phycomyces blakesleeanus NRRL 1555(-)]|eukprot:XP_018284750.1 hypothetical protein PHYBLDRAFT_160567 [Phycomyces blakesleeanus NRRL 1555(-)]
MNLVTVHVDGAVVPDVQAQQQQQQEDQDVRAVIDHLKDTLTDAADLIQKIAIKSRVP